MSERRPHEVSRQLDLDAEVDDVWEAIVSDEERSAWMGGDTEVPVEPGGRGFVTDDDGTRREVRVDEVEPGRRLSFDWWSDEEAPSHVELVLVPLSAGTRLIVTERPLVPGARLHGRALAMQARLGARAASLVGV